MPTMRNCPFCRKPVEGGWPYVRYCESIEKWVFDHFCNREKPTLEVCVTVYGLTEQEVIDKWNGEREDFHA